MILDKHVSSEDLVVVKQGFFPSFFFFLFLSQMNICIFPSS